MIEVLKQALECGSFPQGSGIIHDLKKLIAELESQNIKQITVKDFIRIADGKEDMVGTPIIWAQWPNGNTHLPQRTEQEPVAYINVEERKLEWAKPMSWNTPTTVNLPKIPLYTHLPQCTWVGLTDEEIEERQEEFEEIEDMPFSQNDWLWFYTRAIEAKLKEKNT